MKTLSEYTQEKQTKLFEACGAFFSFSQEQLNEKKVEGVEYVSLGSGLIVSKEKAKELFKGLKTIHAEGIKQDIEENGKSAIIQRELGNHEAHIVMSIDDTVDALVDYGFSREDIQDEYKLFFEHCIENDFF